MKNLFYVFLSKIVVLIIGVVAGFIIPWILGVEEYGYYQVFILYMGYLGLFHFGFNDGIYLKYGAYDFNKIPRDKFIGYFKYLLLKQLLLMIIGIFIALIFFEEERRFIFLMLSFSIVLVNLISYFYFISQITRNFKLFSLLSILQKVLILIPIIFSIVFGGFYQTFIIANLLINFVICCIYIYIYREIVIGKKSKILKKDLKELYLLGIPLLLGNFVAVLIFTFDKMVIDILYSVEELAYYALAVNMLGVVLLFFDSIYQVLYPNIKRLAVSSYNEIYMHLSNIVMWITFIGVSSYFAFSFLINAFLKDYTSSLEIFSILIVGVMLRGENAIVKRPFILSEKKQNINFIINLVILIISIILNILAFIIFKNLISIAIASLISFFIWYILLDILFFRMKYTIRKRKYLYLLMLTSLYFCLLLYKTNIYLSFGIYLFAVVIILLLEKNEIIKTYKYIVKMIKNK